MSVVALREGMVYLCANCKKWYRKGTVRCAVFHMPGDCCHYGDEEVTEPRPVHYQDSRPLEEAR